MTNILDNNMRLIEQPPSCACCFHRACSCPLRSNQMAPTTTKTAIYPPVQTKARRNCNYLTTTSSNTTTMGATMKQHKQRRPVAMTSTNTQPSTASTNSNNSDCQLVNSSFPHHRSPLMTAGGARRSTHLLRHLFLVGLMAIVPRFANAAAYTDAALISQSGPSSGPSMCPLVPSCTCKWSSGKQGKFDRRIYTDLSDSTSFHDILTDQSHPGLGATCERRNLAHIPSQLPSDTQILDMTGNNLQQLPSHIFQEKHLTNLQKLFLSDCKISYIADEAFAQLTNLVELDLSHNNIQFMPPLKTLGPIHNSLRKLIMSYNPLQVIEPNSFSTLVNLNTLDLSNCQLSQLRAQSFAGLNQLKELKLNDNRLTQLPMNVTSDFNQFLDVDLYANPWHCDCELRQSIEWISRHHIQQSMMPTCGSPTRHKDIRWNNIKAEEFMCPPIVINRQHEIVVGAGSNISLPCSARGSAPLTFVWFQDERNLTTTRSNQSEPPPSTKLLEEKRYEIVEDVTVGSPNITTSILYLMNLKLTDTSLFLCWVENGAGYTIANYSLIVNDSPPASFIGTNYIDGNEQLYPPTGGSSSFLRYLGLDKGETQAGFIGVLFLFVLMAVIVVLFLVLKQNYANSKGSQSSGGSDIKHTSKAIESLSAANKFSNKSAMTVRRSNSDVDEEEYYDEDCQEDYDQQLDDQDNSGTDSSSGSCRKSGKVMAASDLDGFIEHMRSGIINMDYHQMSPAIQFNNTLKKQQQPQQMMNMSHFPSASQTSSTMNYYVGGGGGSGAGTNSMATTISDLSPSSGSGNVNFAPVMMPPAPSQSSLRVHPHQAATLLNCDQLHLQNHQHLIAGAPATNTTTTSYTSDYQSGYGAPIEPAMYYESAQLADFYNGTQLYNGVHLLQPPQDHLMQQQLTVDPSLMSGATRPSSGRRPDSGFQI